MNIQSVNINLSSKEIIISIISIVALNIAVIYLAQFRSSKLFYEVLYTARLTMFLFNAAACLFLLSYISQTIVKFWVLFWTASFIAYAVHVYYSFFLFFNGSLKIFYETQGVFVATLNLVISIWWLFDVVLLWFVNTNSKWVTIQRYGIHILVFLAFFVSTVFLHAVDNKELFVIVMGYILGVTTIICLILKIISHNRVKD
ncbi:MAG: hypothetical protein HND52_00105 [Ignavibacteriae bacterium]|nr:hypothetical protein [Ignavibacteriota bacterium]NOG96348.1 hypothetical protein [Ignavibacteriota bacterium]